MSKKNMVKTITLRRYLPCYKMLRTKGKYFKIGNFFLVGYFMLPEVYFLILFTPIYHWEVVKMT